MFKHFFLYVFNSLVNMLIINFVDVINTNLYELTESSYTVYYFHTSRYSESKTRLMEARDTMPKW